MIRPAVTPDIPRVAEIHVCGWRYAYRGIVPDAELFGGRTVAKAMTQWTRMLEQGVSALVWDDGLIKGFVLHGPCRDDDAPGAHEILAIYVEPAFVREGVGTALMAQAEEVGRAQGRTTCKLWALEGNAKGRAFYEKNGYTLDGGVKIIDEWGGARELRYAKGLSSLRDEGLVALSRA